MENAIEMQIPFEQIVERIFIVRGQKVMLDRDLAVLYGVTTMVLNQAVRRNRSRFPHDFLFEISLHEAESLISQIVISNAGRGGRKKPFLAFTEQGIAMLSSVLNSERAIHVNIQIIRAFTKMREMIAQHAELRNKLEALELRYDEQFKIVFDAIRRILSEEDGLKPEIGFKG